MNSVAAIMTITLIGISALTGQATETTIEPMPAELETRFALSALPPALRDKATVYVLDPIEPCISNGKDHRVHGNSEA